MLQRRKIEADHLLQRSIPARRGGARHGGGARGGGGFTLIEVLVVIAILGSVIGAVAIGYGSLGRAQLRTSAQKMSSAIRYIYDRSIGTAQYYRLEIDLATGSYQAQKSEERFLISRAKEEHQGDDETRRKQQIEQDQLEEQDRSRFTGLGAQLQPPPKPKRAKFESYTDAMLPKVTLKGTKIRDVYTPRQTEPYTDGKAYLYFFPDGHTERAVIHLQQGEDDRAVYTLIVHPLTGRVELKEGDIDVPQGFDDTDEEGRREGGR